jgi:hypothetical protein
MNQKFSQAKNKDWGIGGGGGDVKVADRAQGFFPQLSKRGKERVQIINLIT